MRKIWIDTDAASDDALAIMMALYEPSVEVVGISLVSGYRKASEIRQNPFIICARAGYDVPAVHPGTDIPFGYVPTLPEVYVHGNDGLGDLPHEDFSAAPIGEVHSWDAICDAADKYAGELEIVALGPMTNIALALKKRPDIAQKIKAVMIMGGTGIGVMGNISAVCEANIGGDPEAAQYVLCSGVPCSMVGLDAAGGDMFYTEEDIADLANAGPAGKYFVDASHDMIDFLKSQGVNGLSQPDPAAMGAILWPDMITEGNMAHCEVECRGQLTIGMVVEDTRGILANNCYVVHKMDGAKFKKKVLELLTGKGTTFIV